MGCKPLLGETTVCMSFPTDHGLRHGLGQTGPAEPFHLPALYVLVLFGKGSPVSPGSEHSGRTHTLQRLPVTRRHA